MCDRGTENTYVAQTRSILQRLIRLPAEPQHQISAFDKTSVVEATKPWEHISLCWIQGGGNATQPHLSQGIRFSSLIANDAVIPAQRQSPAHSPETHTENSLRTSRHGEKKDLAQHGKGPVSNPPPAMLMYILKSWILLQVDT